MPNRSTGSLAVALLFGAGLAGGCGFGESGVEPPVDRLFLTAGLAADPDGRWLYAVNSNSDLRFNAGTVVAVDLKKAQDDRTLKPWAACPNPGYLPDENGPGTCCWDYFDQLVLNCDDRLYVDRKATVRIGSFGGSTAIEPRSDLPGAKARLYIAVRSEPSVTFLDLNSSELGASIKCEPTGAPAALCDDAHKVRGDSENISVSAVRLLEEPHSMELDSRLGLLYVGHLIEGLSLIDTCPAMPQMLAVSRRIFNTGGLGVTSVLVPNPGIVTEPVLVTSRSFTGRAAEVQNLSLRGVTGGCGTARAPDVQLVESEGFFSSAFFADGSDIRDIEVDGDRAYLLHRNAIGRQNPPAVVEVDRSLDPQGKPYNRAVALVETCTGATEMHLYDAGRGKRLYVVCFDAGQIYVLDTTPLSVAGIINVGRGPTTMVFPPKASAAGGQLDGQNVAYVAGFSDNNVSVIDLAPGSKTENRVVQRIGFPQLRKR